MNLKLGLVVLVLLSFVKVNSQWVKEIKADAGIGFWLHNVPESLLTESQLYYHTRHSFTSGLSFSLLYGEKWKVGPKLGVWFIIDEYMIGPDDNEIIVDRFAVGDPAFGAYYLGIKLERNFSNEKGNQLGFYTDPSIFWMRSLHPENDQFKSRFQLELGSNYLIQNRAENFWMAGIYYRTSWMVPETRNGNEMHRIYQFGLQLGYRW